ncbi:MAG: PIN domain-containing protein [Micropruina sp.]|nr:PIN domain-containing protein [Micropruina sp.]
MKDRPARAVVAWAQSLRAADLTISVVTVEEIEWGLGRLPTGKRRFDLERRWHKLVDAFRDAIVVYDVAAAGATAAVLVDADDGGHPMGLADAQIAGICLASGARLATRNVRDFERVAGLALVNPFD